MSDILHGSRNRDFRLVCIQTGSADSGSHNGKFRIGQSEAEAVANRHIEGIEITVSDENPFFVLLRLYVAVLMAEGLGVGVICVGISPGIRHFSAWIYGAGKDIRKRRTAFLTGLHELHDGFYICKRLSKGQINQTSRIDNENYVVIGSRNLCQKRFFFFCDEVIPFRIVTIRIFPCNTAEHKYRRVGSIRLCSFLVQRIAAGNNKRCGGVRLEKVAVILLQFIQDRLFPGLSCIRVNGLIRGEPYIAGHLIACGL